MEYRRLGRSGLKVSEICLGTMTFGHGTDAAEAERIVLAALDAGVNFFDTADGYSGGVSETMLGRALGSRRRDAVIATKVFNAMGPGPNRFGHVACSHHECRRGQPAPARHRLHRPLLHPSRRRADAARGDAARLRRSRAPGQDPLHRLQQLRGLAADGRRFGSATAKALPGSTRTSRNTAWSFAISRKNWFPPAPSKGSAWWCGRRSPADICRASTSRANRASPARVRRKTGRFRHGFFTRNTSDPGGTA